MSGPNHSRLHSRIGGRQALERRLRAVVIATHRFANGRARSAKDVLWCARVIDTLSELLPTEPRAADGINVTATDSQGDAA